MSDGSEFCDNHNTTECESVVHDFESVVCLCTTVSNKVDPGEDAPESAMEMPIDAFHFSSTTLVVIGKGPCESVPVSSVVAKENIFDETLAASML